MEDLRENLGEMPENVEGTPTEESVEQVTEPEKVYTEEEFNRKLDEVLGKKIARNNAKIRKEYEQKYGELETVLRAGTGKEDVIEIADTFRDFYEKKGIQMPMKPSYSSKDIEILARAEADDIIKAGFDEVVEEVDRLAKIGVSNMDSREREVFKTLAEYRQNTERSKELSKIGVTKEEYESKEFQEFASKFNSGTSIVDIYNIYEKTKPKKEIRQPGSMKNAAEKEDTVKDFYSYEEAKKFTKKDFDRNPELFKAVERSMPKWK